MVNMIEELKEELRYFIEYSNNISLIRDFERIQNMKELLYNYVYSDLYDEELENLIKEVKGHREVI